MQASLTALVPRRLTELVGKLLHDEPVILLQGPHAVGKPTLLRDLAAACKPEVMDLDDLPTDAVRVDPSLFAAAEAPVLVDEDLVTATPSTSTRADHISRAVAGGFPVALARSTETARGRWFDDYVRTVLERDVVGLSRIRQRALLPRLLTR